MIKRFAIGIFSFSITLFTAEAAVRHFKPQATFSYADRYSMKCFAKDPDIDWTLQKSCSFTHNHPLENFQINVSTNSLGFRGREVSLSKPADTKRILVLGDSFTYGFGAENDQTIPALLEKTLQPQIGNVEVINAGFADGQSPDSYLVFLKKRGLALNPDLVILNFYVGNDMIDVADSIWEKTDSAGLPEKIVSCCRKAIDGVLTESYQDIRFRYPVLRESHLFQLVLPTLKKYIPALSKSQSVARKEYGLINCPINPSCLASNLSAEETKTYQLLKATSTLSLSHNIPFLVVLLPSNIQIDPNSWGKYILATWTPNPGDENFIQKRISATLDQFQIPYLDLFPVFSELKGQVDFYLPKDPHFNYMGNLTTAEQTATYILNHHLLE